MTSPARNAVHASAHGRNAPAPGRNLGAIHTSAIRQPTAAAIIPAKMDTSSNSGISLALQRVEPSTARRCLGPEPSCLRCPASNCWIHRRRASAYSSAISARRRLLSLRRSCTSACSCRTSAPSLEAVRRAVRLATRADCHQVSASASARFRPHRRTLALRSSICKQPGPSILDARKQGLCHFEIPPARLPREGAGALTQPQTACLGLQPISGGVTARSAGHWVLVTLSRLLMLVMLRARALLNQLNTEIGKTGFGGT